MAEVIYTNHLLERVKERGISRSEIQDTISHPSSVESSRTSTARKFIKNFNQYRVVAAVKKEGDKWLVVSAWKKPYFGYGRSAPKRGGNLLERLIDWLLTKLESAIRSGLNR